MSGIGTRRPRRAAWSAVIAPEATTFTGSARPTRAAATMAQRGVVVLDDGERGIGESAERHPGLAQEASEGRWHVGTEHRCEADRSDGDADVDPLSRRCARWRRRGASPVARGSDRSRLAGRVMRYGERPVDLDAAAHDDVFERGALGCGTEDRGGRLIGEDGSHVRCRGIGLPDADVDQHVRVELGDGFDDSVVLVGVNSVKDRTLEPVSRRIGIDSGQFPTHDSASSRPAIVVPSSPPTPLTNTRLPAITMNASTTRRQLIGSAVAFVVVGAAWMQSRTPCSVGAIEARCSGRQGGGRSTRL